MHLKRFTRFSRPLTILAVLVMLVFPVSSAFASATSFTVNGHGTYSFSDVAPCGAPGLYTITADYNNVFHFSDNGNSFHNTFTETASFVATPDDPSNPTYTGHYTFWDGSNSNTRNFTDTLTFIVNGTGSDGSTIHFTEVAHFSASATGINISFDRPVCH